MCLGISPHATKRTTFWQMLLVAPPQRCLQGRELRWEQQLHEHRMIRYGFDSQECETIYSEVNPKTLKHKQTSRARRTENSPGLGLGRVRPRDDPQSAIQGLS